jgi:hypothetical protein
VRAFDFGSLRGILKFAFGAVRSQGEVPSGSLGHQTVIKDEKEPT